MDQIETALVIGLAMLIGFAAGYILRSAISSRRRRNFQRVRRQEMLRAAEANKALAMKDAEAGEVIPLFLTSEAS